MKSIVAFLLAGLVLGSSLLPGFGVDQSARLVDLVEHYQEHRQTEPELGFLDFMVMHYGVNSEHQKHPNHSHQNLPSSSHSMPVYTAQAIRLLLVSSASVLIAAKADFVRKADLYDFLATFALINPPRA
ncbi:hypothetical protein [Spirosoma foliorum]|uniref:Uncharacterized protein n=1 Tax=Spirosoma foliorum TaxID=2710596 RepID=A0A7G5GQ67_9BACT|nr:hypothetical protein [Spirosoma foliorum]QMW01009.1 hypothetical protein H3H32_23935 [Spirosoma foliorum]